ncbi:quinon protein alcohol dehydrogenase-like superfamily [Diplogelasinospora grovesii]|uniref:Quinon protein alcohol dehydrogenase-like superfamily n=1 Tax=Diplogelasinospora grovesii TaxID=303347 RepID=A0AAN6MX43_9PEZI|nr:quinon protein alcohol dehydrogenase-like superfamily [Diplogelasinospora grovesii]
MSSLPSLLALLFTTITWVHAGGGSSDWSGWGGNSFNNRWQPSTSLTASNVPSLTRRCSGLVYPFGISATPVISGKVVYYPTWNGSFVALDYTTCQIQWQINVTQIIYDFAPLDPQTETAVYKVSRTSPQIDGDVLYFGTQAHALMVAVNVKTGSLLDIIQIHPHPLAIITTSPTLYNGTLFLGTSSYEEPAPLEFPGYPCCSFIGNAVALSFNRYLSKFSVKWNVATLPSNSSWSGAGIWGSQPSIDPSRNQVFFGTGNVYSFPPEFAHCANETSACLPAGVNQESILALSIPTGKINWVRRITRMDAWNGACVLSPIDTTACAEDPPGTDADFGMAPSFVPHQTTAFGKDMVVVGQKNGVLYAFDAADGTTIWQQQTSSDGLGGGISWGIAMDDKQIYFTLPFTTTVDLSEPTSVFGAADLGTGKVLWQVPAATGNHTNAFALTAPTVAGDLVFYPRTGIVKSDGSAADYDNSQGGLVVVDKSGKVVADMTTDTTFQGGIAVSDGYVMFGTGYRNGQQYLGNGSLYILEIAKK